MTRSHDGPEPSLEFIDPVLLGIFITVWGVAARQPGMVLAGLGLVLLGVLMQPLARRYEQYRFDLKQADDADDKRLHDVKQAANSPDEPELRP